MAAIMTPEASTAAALVPGVVVAAIYGECCVNFSPVRYNGHTIWIREAAAHASASDLSRTRAQKASALMKAAESRRSKTNSNK